MKKFFIPALFIVMCTILACEPNKVDTNTGRLRVINASYLSGGVNIFADYEQVYNTAIQYLNYSLYRDYITGKHLIDIRDVNNNILDTVTLQIDFEKSYSLIVYDSANTIQHKIIDDNYITPNGSMAKVRFLHLSNNMPSIHVLSSGSLAPLASNLNNGDYTSFQDILAGFQNFSIQDASTSQIVYTQPSIELHAGKFYTMYLKGNLGSLSDDSLGVFVIENNADY
ncbi:MAG: DUF4397 domain-containing protein [Chitinophagaceae bacterium]